MITIIHGDNTAKSREYFLFEKGKIKDCVCFDKEININDLHQVVQGESLFFKPKNLFIENFFSNKKRNSIEFRKIAEFINKQSLSLNIYLWEGKFLEKNKTSIFKNSIQKVFNYPQDLFLFLDRIVPNSIDNVKMFHQALKRTEVELLFFMLIRQFRFLLAILNHASNQIYDIKRLMPWQKAKLEKQARLFSNEKLLKIYSNLLEIDIKQKSGTLGSSLIQAIDILLVKI